MHPDHGRATLPWVRLHGTRGYSDMLAALERQPGMRVTLNWVPVLLDQLEAAAGGAEDDWERDARQDPEGLDAARRRVWGERLFSAHRERMIDPLPRYRELAEWRDAEGTGGYGRQDWLDLVVLFHLAWCGDAMRQDERVRGLLEKGRGYTEADRDWLLERQREELGTLVPRARALQERGQVELSTSPYHHAILPLLCDLRSEEYPGGRESPFHLAYPQDASDHLARAMHRHAEVFGRPPSGLWPSEGAVSMAAAERIAAAGLSWFATDEALLFESLAEATSREVLYRPYSLGTDAGETRVLFRDHDLSDRIGFAYQSMAAEDAVADFVWRLEEIAARVSHEDAVVAVILDGENAWESYPEAGRPFLDTLYGRLVEHDTLQPCTMSEAATRSSSAPLAGLSTGSWIDGNLNTWAGHAEKLNAWRALHEVRAAAGSRPLDELEHELATCLRVLEGSDWYWWLGDDHFTEHPEWFDDLFLARLERARRLLGMQGPLPRLRGDSDAVPLRSPLDDVAPTGAPADMLEWTSGGCFEVRAAAGAMTAAHREPGRLWFGWQGRVLHVALRWPEPLRSVRLLPLSPRHATLAPLEDDAPWPRFAWPVMPDATSVRFRLQLEVEGQASWTWPLRGAARIVRASRSWSA